MRDDQFIESRAPCYRWIAFIVFFISGFAALLYQVIWQRLLVFFSGADVYAVTLIVTTFMAGLGLGNLVGGYVADRFSRRTNLVMFIAAELAIMIFGLLSKGFFYDFLYTRHPELGQSSWLLWIVLFCSLLWPTFFMGVSLPLLAKALTAMSGTRRQQSDGFTASTLWVRPLARWSRHGSFCHNSVLNSRSR